MGYRSIPAIVLVLAAAASSPAPSAITGDPSALIVHEWGTFTSIAGPDGSAVEWLPLAGPSDLPCFVNRGRFNTKGGISATVRMETPVLYFYAPSDTTVNVSVRFRNGLITEWFPPAARAPRDTPLMSGTDSTIAWRNVSVSPRIAEDFPVEPDPSHYYAARRTNATPLQSGSATERFLFYRGVGRFALPIAATVDADSKVTVRHLGGSTTVGDIILFDNHHGWTTYERRDGSSGQVVGGSAAENQSPAQELETMLIASGLYPEEASAMIETWQDSWFEEGTRLIYIVPQRAIDAILPLEISPAPSAVARVFVGRMELVTPAMATEVTSALLENDLPALRRYGRFLQAIAGGVVARSAGSERALLERRLLDASSALAIPERNCGVVQTEAGR